MDLWHPAGKRLFSTLRKKNACDCLLAYFLLVYFLCLWQDLKSRRNPRLVPYALLDERTKKSNRDSLREAIRTMVGYGYDIDPPDQDGEILPLKSFKLNMYTHSNINDVGYLM